MSEGWRMVPLGDIVTPVSRSIPVMPGTAYRTIGVKWWGEGAYERQTIDGSQTAAKTLTEVRNDDLIINKIWVRHGSVAVAGKEVHGCAASNEFPTFVMDRERVEPRWLHWYSKTRQCWRDCDALSFGSSGKNRIRPEVFTTICVPLPPLTEQRRIVARVEELVAKIEEARGLRQLSESKLAVLQATTTRKTFEGLAAQKLPLEQVCSAVVDNLHSTPKYDGDEFPCIRSQDIGWGTIDYETALRTSREEFGHRTQRGEPRAGDIVYVREGDVGRCALLDGSRKISLGQRVMMFRPNPRVVIPEFLLHQLLAPTVLDDQVRSGKTGTTSHHVNISHLRQVVVAVPDIQEQLEIVAVLNEFVKRMEHVKKLQARTRLELGALLPTVLDRAFRGEL